MSVSGEEGHSTIITFYGFIENKVIFSDAGYAAKLHKKCLEISLLLCNLHILTSDQKQILFIRATFEQLSMQKATFDCFLSNFLENLEQLVESPSYY